MRRAAIAPLELTEFPELTRAEFLCALRTGLIRRIGATRDGRVVEYELTHVGRVLLGRALPPLRSGRP